MLDVEAIVDIKHALLKWSVRSGVPISDIKHQISNLIEMSKACSDHQAASSLSLLHFSL